MTTAKLTLGTRTQLSGAAAAINSLANGTFVLLGTLTHVSSGKVPLDVLVELGVTPGVPSGNRQAILYAQHSLDGTTFGTGPISGTSTQDEPDLVFVGALPMFTTAGVQRKVFSLATAYGGILPYATKLILKNDCGSAFASSGNDLYTSDVSGDIA